MLYKCSSSVIAFLIFKMAFLFGDIHAHNYINYFYDRIQHPLVWGPAFLISAYTVGVKVQARNATPTKELYNWWDYLFYNKSFRLNRSESLWNIGSRSIYIMSQEKYNQFIDNYSQLTVDDKLDLEDVKLELRYDGTLTPSRLLRFKPFIIMCCNNFLLRVNRDNLSKFTNALDSIITKYEPSNIWERIWQRQADAELLKDLKYRRDQMKIFQDIVQTAYDYNQCGN